jgi:hypothetical protein
MYWDFIFLIDDLIAPNGAEKSINDIPSMLASGEKKTFNVGPPSDSKFYALIIMK